MSDIGRQIDAVIGGIRMLQSRAHAGHAIVGAAIMERRLGEALRTKMRPLSRSLDERLFEGYGPLATLAARADLAYALSLINKDAYDKLTTARRVRNRFAHTDDLVDFDDVAIKGLLGGGTGGERQVRYLELLKDVDAQLDPLITEASA